MPKRRRHRNSLRSCPSCKNFRIKGSIDDILEHMLANNDCKEDICWCPHCQSNFIDMTSLAKHIFASPQCSSAERISNQPSDLVGTATSNNSRIQSIVTQEIAPSSVNRHEPSLTYNISHAEVINTRLTPLSSANNPLNTNGALPLNENEIHDNNEQQQLDQDHDDNENDDYILPLNEGVEFENEEQYLQWDDAGDDNDNDFDRNFNNSDEEPDELSVHRHDFIENHGDQEFQQDEEPVNHHNILDNQQPSLVILEMGSNLREARKESLFMLQTRKQELLDLYLVTIGKGSSLTTFDETLKWSNRHSNNKYQGLNRANFLKEMGSLAYGSTMVEDFRPKSKEILLSTGRKTVITLFNLNAVITDLLCNSDLMKKENLIFDYNVEFSDCVQHQSNVYGDVNTGSWWRDTQNDICAGTVNGKRKVLWPLILFIDGVCHGDFQKLSQEPVLATFSAFKREVRNRPEAWRPLAYLDFKGNMQGKVSGKQSLQEYSDVLKEVFKELAILQKHGFEWNFEFEHPNDSNVILMIPIQFIIGDCEGHDKLVGRYACHTIGAKCLVRDCFILTEEAADPNHVCVWRTPENMAEHLVSDERSQQTSFHVVTNPFHEVLSFGTDERGIYGATMPEILHMYNQGILTFMADIIIHDLSAKGEKALDSVCAHLYHTARVQSSREFPLIGAFREGISSVSKLKAEERLSRVFVIYQALMCSSFVSYLQRNKKQGSDDHSIEYFQSLTYVLENAMCLHDFLKKDIHDISDFHHAGNGESIALRKVRIFMQSLLDVLPTEKGMGWMKTKFHQLIHIILNTIRHGCACNWDGGRPEYFGKYFAKNNATRTQKRQISLAWQTALRFFEHHCVLEVERLLVNFGKLTIKDTSSYSHLFDSKETEIEFANEHMSAPIQFPVPAAPIIAHSAQGSRFTYGSDGLDGDLHERKLKWDNKAPSRGFDDNLLRFLANRLWLHDSGGVISQNSVVNGYTELKYGDDLFRAHPLYRKSAVWNDWAMISWAGGDQLLPARILMFISLKNCEIVANNDDPFLERKDYAVIHSVVDDDYVYRRNGNGQYALKSRIATRHVLERSYRLVPIEAIAGPAYVFANDAGKIEDELSPYDHSIICLKDRSCWKDSFLRNV